MKWYHKTRTCLITSMGDLFAENAMISLKHMGARCCACFGIKLSRVNVIRSVVGLGQPEVPQLLEPLIYLLI